MRFSVPRSVIVGWVLVGFVALKVSTKKGTIIGVLSVYAIDLFLQTVRAREPLKAWRRPITPLNQQKKQKYQISIARSEEICKKLTR